MHCCDHCRIARLIESRGRRFLRPFRPEPLHRDSIAAPRADDVGAIGQHLLSRLEHQLLARPEHFLPDAVRNVSFSAGRQAFCSKLTRVETVVVFSDHRIALDSPAHLGSGLQPTVHDRVAVVWPSFLHQRALSCRDWKDSVILCAQPRRIGPRWLRQPKAKTGRRHPDDQEGRD